MGGLLLLVIAAAALLLLPVVAPRLGLFAAVAVLITGIVTLREPDNYFVSFAREYGWALVAVAAIMTVTAVVRLVERRARTQSLPPAQAKPGR